MYIQNVYKFQNTTIWCRVFVWQKSCILSTDSKKVATCKNKETFSTFHDIEWTWKVAVTCLVSYESNQSLPKPFKQKVYEASGYPVILL